MQAVAVAGSRGRQRYSRVREVGPSEPRQRGMRPSSTQCAGSEHLLQNGAWWCPVQQEAGGRGERRCGSGGTHVAGERERYAGRQRQSANGALRQERQVQAVHRQR